MKLTAFSCFLVAFIVVAQQSNATHNQFLKLRRNQPQGVQAGTGNSTESPTQGPPSKDAPYSVDQSAIEAIVECPGGTSFTREGGVLLLVHGTTGTGKGTWGNGPFTQILPSLQPEFDVCYLTLPNRANTDVQVTSEYVAGNIAQLAKKSKTGRVSLIGHSQGAVNIQWALTFYPRTRQYVQHFVSIAGDFKGSDKGPDQCKSTGEKNDGKCPPAIIQLSSTSSENKYSNFINALNKFGGKALVPTTSIYTEKDDVVQPSSGDKASGVLPGADNISLQDDRICGSDNDANHFRILGDPANLALAYGALSQQDGMSSKNFDRQYCSSYVGKNAFETMSIRAKNFPANIQDLIKAGDSLNQFATAKTEPKLMSYVCDNGSAPADQCK